MKMRFSGEQIIGILKEQEAGFAVKDLIRRHGMAEKSSQHCKSWFGGCALQSRIAVYCKPCLPTSRNEPPSLALCCQKRISAKTVRFESCQKEVATMFLPA